MLKIFNQLQERFRSSDYPLVYQRGNTKNTEDVLKPLINFLQISLLAIPLMISGDSFGASDGHRICRGQLSIENLSVQGMANGRFVKQKISFQLFKTFSARGTDNRGNYGWYNRARRKARDIIRTCFDHALIRPVRPISCQLVRGYDIGDLKTEIHKAICAELRSRGYQQKILYSNGSLIRTTFGDKGCGRRDKKRWRYQLKRGLSEYFGYSGSCD